MTTIPEDVAAILFYDNGDREVVVPKPESDDPEALMPQCCSYVLEALKAITKHEASQCAEMKRGEEGLTRDFTEAVVDRLMVDRAFCEAYDAEFGKVVAENECLRKEVEELKKGAPDASSFC